MPISEELKRAREVGDPQAYLAAGGALREGRIPEIDPMQAITGADLEPTPAVEFQQPEETPIFPVVELDAELPTLTQPEQETQEITQQIQQLSAGLVGEAEFRAAEEEKRGISELERVQTDLATRLRAIQREAQAIPLQMQQEAIGRGITRAGLRPLQTARLRENAIQALTTASQLEAARGNLTTALDLADRAVAQKYDPIKEDIAVKLANLELIRKSPAYTRAEQERATKQQRIQKAEERRIEQLEENEQEIKKIMAQAAQLNADPETLEKISIAKTPIEALQAAGHFLGADFRAKLEEQTFKRALQESTYQLSVDKFKEDTRQFNIEYARRQQEQALKDITDKAKTLPTEYSIERGRRTYDTAGELLDKVTGMTVGLGSWLSIIPATDARNFKAELDKLKANIAFGELTAMREASKTGGALGQVSEKELRLLESALGALDTGQSPENFRKSLEQIQTSVQNWYKAQGVDITDPGIEIAEPTVLGTNVFLDVLGSPSSTPNISPFYSPETGYNIPQ